LTENLYISRITMYRTQSNLKMEAACAFESSETLIESIRWRDTRAQTSTTNSHNGWSQWYKYGYKFWSRNRPTNNITHDCLMMIMF
jgi:hypothetical protein